MRRSIVLGATMLVCLATPAAAQAIEDAEPAAAEPSDPFASLAVSGGVTLVSDYRFRGISQSDKRVAVQGTATVDHVSGFYANIWASSIAEYVAGGADGEIDLSAGFRRTVRGTTYDAGVLYYVYPGSKGTASDYFEPYASVSHTLGPVTGRVSAAYAPKQNALSIGAGREDNLHVAGDLSAGIPGTPVGLSARVGRNFGPGHLNVGEDYTHWGLAATYTMRSLTFGLGYVDTDTAFVTPRGRDAAKAGVVASVGFSF